MTQLTHINDAGEAHMVDVSEKKETLREAKAEAYVTLSPKTFAAVLADELVKGDVYACARIAGIQAAKKTGELIPLCHSLLLTKISVVIEALPATQQLRIESYCRLVGKTGVEMEALTAASTAALTIYDMCKALQKDIVIGPIQLISKQGGKSGDYQLIKT